MRLTEQARNTFVDDLTHRLAGGELAIYEGPLPASPTDSVPTFKEPLVRLHLPAPAFAPAVKGSAEGYPMEVAPILATGEASWARLTSAKGEVVADLVVTAIDAKNVRDADVIVDRTDFHRGGKCTVTHFALRLPMK